MEDAEPAAWPLGPAAGRARVRQTLPPNERFLDYERYWNLPGAQPPRSRASLTTAMSWPRPEMRERDRRHRPPRHAGDGWRQLRPVDMRYSEAERAVLRAGGQLPVRPVGRATTRPSAACSSCSGVSDDGPCRAHPGPCHDARSSAGRYRRLDWAPPIAEPYRRIDWPGIRFNQSLDRIPAAPAPAASAPAAAPEPFPLRRNRSPDGRRGACHQNHSPPGLATRTCHQDSPAMPPASCRSSAIPARRPRAGTAGARTGQIRPSPVTPPRPGPVATMRNARPIIRCPAAPVVRPAGTAAAAPCHERHVRRASRATRSSIARR